MEAFYVMHILIYGSELQELYLSGTFCDQNVLTVGSCSKCEEIICLTLSTESSTRMLAGMDGVASKLILLVYPFDQSKHFYWTVQINLY